MLQVRDPDAFQETVVQAREPTVVMFWATWCPFSRRFNAEFEKLAASRPWRFAAVYLDDELHVLWDASGVEVVPSLPNFRPGLVADWLGSTAGIVVDTRMPELCPTKVVHEPASMTCD